MADVTDYKINGTPTSIAPISVQWVPSLMGRDHNNAPIYALDHTIIMQFDGGSVAHVQQWLDNASGASVNLTTLNRWQLAMTTLPSVYMENTTPPTISDVNAGPFTIIVYGARPA